MPAAISHRPEVELTLSTFRCERCRGTVPKHSRRKGILEHSLLQLLLIRYYRCADCGERYATFGVGESRTVIRQKTTRTARTITLVTLFAIAITGIIVVLFSLD
jgi:hypothetical protein